ncbi:nuclear transport factor 2 family protein [Paucibacter sp. APW11]|uniref:Nuclear transport factor 2 family protein n=1 Tax=Roseateles aquae TaxID=3077235 RepID=A0ABU3P9X3_9BURK|nr:nuclear transport factor 2 family protein [Paucibacter sp. APW11]MDT8998888.1 nuclear transport factor 2 family protein [Paucibacter sp. APW11]
MHAEAAGEQKQAAHAGRRAVRVLCRSALPFAVALAMPVAVAAPAGSAPQAVRDAECAFARSMASRDFSAFGSFVSEQAVFFGAAEVLRGKSAVLKGWQGFFEAASAPFSWAPDQVEVLADGQLALSTGLVRGPDGQAVLRFSSIWKLEGDQWRVVFDKGGPLSTAERERAGEADKLPCPRP